MEEYGMKKQTLFVLLTSGFMLACSEGSTTKTSNSSTPPTHEKASELSYTDGIFLEVISWGPRATQQGQAFNRQASGSSAFWINVANKKKDAEYILWLDDLPLRTKNSPDSPAITGSLTEEEAAKIVAHPGTRTLSLLEKNKKIRQIVGEFLIE